MGSVQTYETFHRVTDGNGNDIIGKWFVDPFCDGNGNGKKHTYMSHFAYACKTEGQNGISRLISELLRTLDSSLRDRLFVLQNEVF